MAERLTDRVLVGIASIPEREASLQRVVASLAPQADRIHVALNEYQREPAFLADHPNVTAELLDADNGGDAEKYRAVDDWDGLVATCDDDILYPADYIATLRAGIARYGPRTMVGFHGGVTLGWNGSAIAASHKRVRCLGTLDADDTDINVLGTGCLMYHAGHVPVWRDVFRSPNMADVHMACHARTMGIPMVCLAHNEGWLQDICPPVGQGRRIYDANRNRDGSRLDTREAAEAEIRRFNWLEEPPARPHVRVSVATCARPHLLAQLLDDLEREARWVDLDVAVFEDPSDTPYDALRARVRACGWEWHRMPHRMGREQYGRLVGAQYAACARSPAEWFVFMPDDVRLVRHAIPRAIATWGRLEDPATLTLWRLASLEGLANWTGKPPIPRGEATETFHVDGFFLCRRETLQRLHFACPQPAYRPESSSGVGRKLSRMLDARGMRMYRVDRSLGTANDGGVSVMNPGERARNPTVTL